MSAGAGGDRAAKAASATGRLVIADERHARERLCVASLCAVEQTRRRLDALRIGGGDLLDHLGPATLAEVGDALDEGHAGPPSAGEVADAARAEPAAARTT